MSSSGNKTNSRTGLFFLLAVTAVALCLCYVLVAPFLKAILFAMVLAVLSFPLHSRIQRRVRSRNASALLSTCLLVLFIVLSTVLLGHALATGLRDVYQALSSSGDGSDRLSLYVIHLFERAVEWVSSYLPISTSDLRSATLNQAERGVSTLIGMTAGVLGGFTALLGNALIAFFVLFFLLRDGSAMLRRAVVLLPLRRDQTRRLFTLVKDIVNATVYGTLAMAALQGALAGLAFWFLGVTSAGLWGTVTALCALLPFIGTGIVLLPAISMLIFSGHWIKGIILLAWGLAVVHPVDNLLRPHLIGTRTKLSTLYVFFALLGGLKAFGGLGLFIGPMILALTLALLEFLREEKRAGNWRAREELIP
ncbi:MAG TPA: AI-2E family transporter [Candidatus Sulfotelmatobacter sp.]|nr:AI-2E family transporter [Candidatus Sulfotelmatobacter sp.]